MNLGIIAASMPALPQFFAKSRIFRASTYTSLQRLLNRRGLSFVPRSGQSSKTPAFRDPGTKGVPAVRGENWTELPSLPDVRAYSRTDISQEQIFLNEGTA